MKLLKNVLVNYVIKWSVLELLEFKYCHFETSWDTTMKLNILTETNNDNNSLKFGSILQNPFQKQLFYVKTSD